MKNNYNITASRLLNLNFLKCNIFTLPRGCIRAICSQHSILRFFTCWIQLFNLSSSENRRTSAAFNFAFSRTLLARNISAARCQSCLHQMMLNKGQPSTAQQLKLIRSLCSPGLLFKSNRKLWNCQPLQVFMALLFMNAQPSWR